MPGEVSRQFITELERRFGPFQRLEGSQSLVSLRNGTARLYIRYSKVHADMRTWYGLRQQDLLQLAGHPSLICFLWPDQEEPLFVRFDDYEEVFRGVTPAGDRQYKVQVFPGQSPTEMYVSQAGRFNVEAGFGWEVLETLLEPSGSTQIPDLHHSQVQTILDSIGMSRGHDIWIPPPDRGRLDWDLTPQYAVCDRLPERFDPVMGALQAIDVIWLRRASGHIEALYEVEHTTSIYSGLLRFNDIHIIDPHMGPIYRIVAKDFRRNDYVRQLARPTFFHSGLHKVCSFMDYADVYGWFRRSLHTREA